MSEVSLELDSQVNEIYVKTIVTQKFNNPYEKPLELKIYVDKINDILFTCFQAKIGDSIMVKSKIIKKEKAEVKYTDSISSGNAAIFVSEHEGKIIINMGNIPAKEEVIFISEFIHFTNHSDLYEFEILRNLPIFEGKDETFYNTKLKEKIKIKTINKLFNIAKDININELKIIEEKYLNEEKNEYLISYEIEKMPKYYSKSFQASKIFFDTYHNEPTAFLQKSLKINENNYVIQCKPKYTNEKEKEKEISPGLFIFLIDQSGSMWGDRIEITKKALQLFLQSLPAKSYYQLVGFGTNYKKYDEIPKEYTQENINQSIKLIETLEADLGGTNIYDPLSDVSFAKYESINLKKNIFILTDGYIEEREKTLNFIKTNNSKFRIFSIGIGDSFDEELIKEAGLNGRGGYNFCKKLDGLNSIIAKEINNANKSWISNFKVKCSLDNDNICEIKLPEIIRENDIINLNYIIPRKNIDKINLEITYSLDNNEKKQKYEISPKIIYDGDEISKLIIKDFINNIADEDEKIKKSLKYQIFNNNTSLFAEVELSDKISEEMKLKIIGNEKNNILEILKPKEEKNTKYNNYYSNNYNYSYNTSSSYSSPFSFMMGRGMPMCGGVMMNSMPMGMGFPMMNMSMNMPMMNNMNNMNMGMNNIFMMNNMKMMNNMNMGMNNMNSMNNMMNKLNMGSQIKNNMDSKKENNNNELGKNSKEDEEKNKEIKEEKNKVIEKEELKKKLEEESRIKNEELERKKLAEKEEIMKIVKTQDFINGYWEINEQTKIILEKCKREYELLKGLKDKNIDDKVAITILIIYYINKEHFKLVSEFIMIFKKAKLFIEKETKCSYDEIVENLKSI